MDRSKRLKRSPKHSVAKLAAPKPVPKRETRLGSDDPRRLLHESRVHQIELETQNRELQETKALLEESRARYAELYDRAPAAYLTFDRYGAIRAANLSAAGLLSTDRQSLIGRPLRAFLSPNSRTNFDAQLDHCFRTHTSATGEARLPVRGGERVVELVTAPYLDVLDDEWVCHAVAIDVTIRTQDGVQRDQLLRSEQRARAMAERANATKEEFLAVVSHELRAPLGPMLMWLNVLERETSDPQLHARAVASIAGCARAQAALIEDLVDTARATHGKLQVEHELLDLRQLVDEVVERSLLSAGSKGIHLDKSLSTAWCPVAGDKGRLRQVVGNILSNAIKFSPQGSRIEVSLQDDDTSVVVRVRDEGAGIPSDLIPLLFEPFRQRETTEVRSHGGLGLGLFIARQIVGLHGGTIRAESDGPGLGSTFTVTLPRASVQPYLGSPLLHSSPPNLPAPEQALLNLAVLIVDDDAATLEALKVVLEQHGAKVTAASSAAQGRVVLDRQHADVLISDFAMPDEDGNTFIRALRDSEDARKPPRPLVALVLTAHATPHDRQRSLTAGFDCYLAKPVEVDQLVMTVAQLAKRA